MDTTVKTIEEIKEHFGFDDEEVAIVIARQGWVVTDAGVEVPTREWAD